MQGSLNISGEDKTILEIFYVEDFTSDGRLTDKLTNEPLKVLLKDTLTSDAEFGAECIQARLCSVGLPTTIKDCHVSVTNLSNLVAVQKHCRDASFLVKGNSSVGRLPVLVCLNSGAHLLFDLTHLEVVCLTCVYNTGDGAQINRCCATYPTGLDEALGSHDLRHSVINPHCVYVKVRIETLACINCLLFCLTNVCQLITHGETISTLESSADDELSLSQLYGKNEEQVEDVS